MHGSLSQYPGGSHMERQIRTLSWRADILLGEPLNFGSFRAAKMTPFWGPNFSPPCGQLAAPYLYVHKEPAPRSCLLSCEPLALPWPGEPRVGITPILVILAS